MPGSARAAWFVNAVLALPLGLGGALAPVTLKHCLDNEHEDRKDAEGRDERKQGLHHLAHNTLGSACALGPHRRALAGRRRRSQCGGGQRELNQTDHQRVTR